MKLLHEIIEAVMIVTAFALGAYSIDSHASGADDFVVNLGGVSHHWRNDAKHNDLNIGIGLEYRASPALGFTVGMYDNSDYHATHYALVRYQPFEVATMRLGVLAGIADGYPHMRGGRAVPAGMLAASKDVGPVVFSIVGFPNLGKACDGVVSLQVGIKL